MTGDVTMIIMMQMACLPIHGFTYNLKGGPSKWKIRAAGLFIPTEHRCIYY